jgi:hypothetical protein
MNHPFDMHALELHLFCVKIELGKVHLQREGTGGSNQEESEVVPNSSYCISIIAILAQQQHAPWGCYWPSSTCQRSCRCID